MDMNNYKICRFQWGKIVWISKCNEFATLKGEIEIHVSNGSRKENEICANKK